MELHSCVITLPLLRSILGRGFTGSIHLEHLETNSAVGNGTYMGGWSDLAGLVQGRGLTLFPVDGCGGGIVGRASHLAAGAGDVFR